jgi:hypothetical protein
MSPKSKVQGPKSSSVNLIGLPCGLQALDVGLLVRRSLGEGGWALDFRLRQSDFGL